MPPATLDGAQGSPGSAAAHSVARPGTTQPARSGVSELTRSSANSLSFEIEFGPGEGGWAPLYRARLAQGLPALPSTEITGQGLSLLGLRLAEGIGGSW